MSYATDVLRRRQEFKEAFQKRYNPAEDVLATLAEIDKEAFRREQLAAQEKRDVERFGLEKERIVAQTKKAEQDRTASEMALAAQREARKAEFEARAARQREEARLKEQAEARKTGARTLYGRMTGLGQTARDIWGGTAVGDAEKAYATRMARTLAEGTAAEVAKMDEELAAMQAKAPKAVPGGMTMADVEELAGAFGMTPDEALSLADELRREEEARLAELGLTGARTEQATAAAEAARRPGLPKPAKVLTPEEQQAAKEETTYKRLRNERLKRALSEKGGFVPTEEEVNKMQTARRQVVAAQASTNVLRQLMRTYPEFASYVGPVDGLINRVKAKFGANSKQASDIQSSINRVFQAYKVATTGAAAGVLEMEDLKNIMPKETDNFDAILGKLDAAERMAQTSVDAIDLVLDKMDIRAADPLARAQVAAGEVVTPMPEAEAEQFFEETP